MEKRETREFLIRDISKSTFCVTLMWKTVLIFLFWVKNI